MSAVSPGRDRIRPSVLAPYLVMALAAVCDIVLSAGGRRSQTLLAFVFLTVEIVGLGYSLRAATHPRLLPADRRPWRYVTAAFVLHIVYGALLGNSIEHDSLSSQYYGGALVAAVLVRVIQVPVLLAGLLSFAGEPLTPWVRRKPILDVVTVIGMAAMGIWYWLIGPGLFDSTPTGSVARLAVISLPVCDLVLAVGVVTVLMRGVVTGARQSVRLLLAGVTSNLAVDSFMTYQALLAPSSKASIYTDLAGLLPIVLTGAAAIERCRKASENTPDDQTARRLQPYTFLPYVALVAGYALLMIVALRAGVFPWSGLVLAAMVMTASVAARQLVSLQENHQQAVTDALTGLANRVLLRDRMFQAADQSRRTRRRNALLLIDLDGFKQINDTHGHEAGDAILVAFSRLLTENTRAGDTQARLGGDEFAVLLNGIPGPQDAIDVAERLLTLLREGPIVPASGTTPALSVGCSIGIAVSEPDDQADPHQHLRQSDQAMYVAKRSKTTGWHLYSPDTEREAENGEQAAPKDTAPPIPRPRSGVHDEAQPSEARNHP